MLDKFALKKLNVLWVKCRGGGMCKNGCIGTSIIMYVFRFCTHKWTAAPVPIQINNSMLFICDCMPVDIFQCEQGFVVFVFSTTK
jgi:hypothetical protein